MCTRYDPIATAKSIFFDWILRHRSESTLKVSPTQMIRTIAATISDVPDCRGVVSFFSSTMVSRSIVRSRLRGWSFFVEEESNLRLNRDCRTDGEHRRQFYYPPNVRNVRMADGTDGTH
jgi:hypothetical protein